MFSHIIFLRIPCHGNFWQDPTGLALPGWVLITMDCDRRTEWYNEAKRLITIAVFEHDVIVYVKWHEKRTWLWNLLLDDERERIYIVTLDAVYEDMESLTNLDVAIYIILCDVNNMFRIALKNVMKIYNWLQKNFLNQKYVNTYLLQYIFLFSFPL